jgi:nucleotide-binding universal stress UspA family protein
MGTIVVGVDDSREARVALRWALGEARTHGSKVIAVHAWAVPATGAAPLVGPLVVMEEQTGERAAREQLNAIVREVAAGAGSVEIERVAAEGSAHKVLIDIARSAHADLLVVGKRGHDGFRGLLLGSVASALTRHAPCPLAVIPGPERDD